MRQWGIRVTLAVVLILLTGLAASAEGDWGDGQSAMYVIGQADFETAGTETTASSLSGPRDAAVDDRHQKLYVVDGANNRVLRYALPISSNKPAAELVIGQNDMISSTAATSRTGLSDPRGIALDTTGRFWVSVNRNKRLHRLNLALGCRGRVYQHDLCRRPGQQPGLAL